MPEQQSIQDLIGHWRWASQAGHGGADAYIRVRDAAQRAAFARAVQELERVIAGGAAGATGVTGVTGGDRPALIELAVSLRERVQRTLLPNDVPLPEWPVHRPAPNLDQARVRREQQMGFALALATCASQLQEVAGGE